MTIAEYYKHYASAFGLLTAGVSSLPLLSIFVSEDYASYLFPPLGGMETLCRLVTLVLVLATTLVVYLVADLSFVQSRRGRIKVVGLLALIAMVSLFVFLGLHLRFVREIPIPSANKKEVVSVGYQRTDFAKREFGEADDVEILKSRGAMEEEIFKLWTTSSIIIARLGLFAFYLGCFLLLVTISSLAVLYDKLGTALLP